MNILLIVVGAILIVVGIARMTTASSHEAEPKEPKNNKTAQEQDSDDERITEAKKTGNAFENYVANLFADRQLFRVLECHQGQTSSEGVYAENDTDPDFRILQTFGKNGLEYWVECKYRSRFKDNEIKVDQYQIDRYREKQRSSHRKVFFAIGVGGTPDTPGSFYVMPLDSVPGEMISRSALEPYVMSDPKSAFAPWIESYFVDKVFPKSQRYK